MPRPPKPKRGRARRMDIDPKLPKTARKKEIRKAFSAKQTRQKREQTDGSDIDLVEDVEYKRRNDKRINIDPKLPKAHRKKTRRRIIVHNTKNKKMSQLKKVISQWKRLRTKYLTMKAQQQKDTEEGGQA